MGEKDKQFTGLGGKSWNVAEVSILRRFAELGLDGIVKGEVVFDKQPPSHEEFVTNEMRKSLGRINIFFQNTCTKMFLDRGAKNFFPPNVPLSGNWEGFNFHAAPFNFNDAVIESLKSDLSSEYLWLKKSHLDLEMKKSDLEHQFFLRETAFEDAQRRWEDKITKCVTIWRECLGSRVLVVIADLLGRRDMPGVLQKLRSYYGSFKTDEIAILDKSDSIAYIPSQSTFLGFIKQFEEIYDLYPEENMPSDRFKLSDFIRAIKKGGFEGLNDTIVSYFMIRKPNEITYENAKHCFIESMTELQHTERERPYRQQNINESNEEEGDDEEDGCYDGNSNDNDSRKRGSGGGGPPVCSYCHKTGHYTSQCWHLKKDQEKKRRRRSNSR
jgi:hypothetical protein